MTICVPIEQAHVHCSQDEGKTLCSQQKTVLLKVYDYFSKLEQRGGGQGALQRHRKLPVKEFRTAPS